MAYTLGAVGTASDDNTGNDFTANMPATFSAGDLLLGITRTTPSTLTFTQPTDWTTIATHTSTSGCIALYAKIAAGGDAAPTISWSGSSGHVWNQICAFSGTVYTDLATIVADTATPIAGNGTTIRIPALTVSVANALIIAGGGHNKTATGNGATVTISGGFSSIGTGSFTGTRQEVGWGYIQQTTATDIAQTDWTISISESLARTGITVSLRSAAAQTGRLMMMGVS